MPRSRKKSSSESDTSTRRRASDTDDSPSSSTSDATPLSRSAGTKGEVKHLTPGSELVPRGRGRPPEPVPADQAESLIAIYALCDPDGTIRYIGKAKNPQKRLKQHIRESLKSRGINKHKEAWIRQVHGSGNSVTMRVLEWCSESNWQQAECQWIDRHKSTLTNQTPGGNAPWCSPDVRHALGKRLNRHPERWLHRAIRVMTFYAREQIKRGNEPSARKLVEAVVAIRLSRGMARTRLNQWAMERFDEKQVA
jgi:hypothetical protein